MEKQNTKFWWIGIGVFLGIVSLELAQRRPTHPHVFFVTPSAWHVLGIFYLEPKTWQKDDDQWCVVFKSNSENRSNWQLAFALFLRKHTADRPVNDRASGKLTVAFIHLKTFFICLDSLVFETKKNAKQLLYYLVRKWNNKVFWSIN